MYDIPLSCRDFKPGLQEYMATVTTQILWLEAMNQHYDLSNVVAVSHKELWQSETLNDLSVASQMMCPTANSKN